MLTDDELKKIWEAKITTYDALQEAARLGALKERQLTKPYEKQAVARLVKFYGQRKET